MGFACVGGERKTCDGQGEYSDVIDAAVCKTALAGHIPNPPVLALRSAQSTRSALGVATSVVLARMESTLSPALPFCQKCPSGQFYNSTVTSCELCPKNTFAISGVSAISGCKECASGWHSQPGSSSCEKCSTGEFYNETSTSCELCPKQTFTISGAADINSCASCADGEHSLEGSGYCQNVRSTWPSTRPHKRAAACPPSSLAKIGHSPARPAKPSPTASASPARTAVTRITSAPTVAQSVTQRTSKARSIPSQALKRCPRNHAPAALESSVTERNRKSLHLRQEEARNRRARGNEMGGRGEGGERREGQTLKPRGKTRKKQKRTGP